MPESLRPSIRVVSFPIRRGRRFDSAIVSCSPGMPRIPAACHRTACAGAWINIARRRGQRRARGGRARLAHEDVKSARSCGFSAIRGRVIDKCLTGPSVFPKATPARARRLADMVASMPARSVRRARLEIVRLCSRKSRGSRLRDVRASRIARLPRACSCARDCFVRAVCARRTREAHTRIAIRGQVSQAGIPSRKLCQSGLRRPEPPQLAQHQPRPCQPRPCQQRPIIQYT